MVTQLNVKETSEQIQEDLLTLVDGLPQDTQDKACQIVVDRMKVLQQIAQKHEATLFARAAGIKG